MEKLLIVDGDRHVREIMSERFRKVGHETVEAGSGWSCLQHVENEQVTHVVLNEKLPDMDGFIVLEKLMEQHAGLPVLFILEHSDTQNRIRAISLGASEVLEKPLPLNRLMLAMELSQTKNMARKQKSVVEILAQPAFVNVVS